MSHEQMIDEALNIAARSADLAHLVRVASRLDGEERIVGFLHDSVEDGYATVDELRNLFPSSVVETILVLTRKDGEKYADYIDRIAISGNVRAVRVKLADLNVNLNRARVDRYSLIKRYEMAIGRLELAGA